MEGGVEVALGGAEAAVAEAFADRFEAGVACVAGRRDLFDDRLRQLRRSESSVQDAALQAPIQAPPVPQQHESDKSPTAAPVAPDQQPAAVPPASDTQAEPEAPPGPPVEGSTCPTTTATSRLEGSVESHADGAHFRFGARSPMTSR